MGLTSSGGVTVDCKLPARCDPAHPFSRHVIAASETRGAGTKRFHRRDVGDLDLAYESVDLLSEPGLILTLYAAEPASPTAQAFDLLASWAAAQTTADREGSPTTPAPVRGAAGPGRGGTGRFHPWPGDPGLSRGVGDVDHADERARNEDQLRF
ncbi:hypothetical protein [Micromonospora cremea]|uniref:MmyB family transcriptional regulator n=1 Tax=Micromonospora cremea TaxID=709881 RepID=UPI0013566A9F|nr:hypothetical protein [Micromonospora cremea]